MRHGATPPRREDSGHPHSRRCDAAVVRQLGKCMDRLKNKVCVITGTGSGMGRAAALMFAREGAQVVGCDINVDSAQSTLDAVKSAGGQMASLHPCNMAVRADVDR